MKTKTKEEIAEEYIKGHQNLSMEQAFHQAMQIYADQEVEAERVWMQLEMKSAVELAVRKEWQKVREVIEDISRELSSNDENIRLNRELKPSDKRTDAFMLLMAEKDIYTVIIDRLKSIITDQK